MASYSLQSKTNKRSKGHWGLELSPSIESEATE